MVNTRRRPKIVPSLPPVIISVAMMSVMSVMVVRIKH